MPVYKRATKKLQEAGINLEVRKGLWGPWLSDPTLRRQRGKCYKTPEEAVQAALAGERPVALADDEK
jgi:hypothetical protein